QVDDLKPLRTEIAKRTGDRPVFHARMKTRRIAPIQQSITNQQPPEPIAAFCAVGNPRSFFTHLNRDGHQLVLQRSFRDHYVYTQDDVSKLSKAAIDAGAQSLMTTAKDAVKLRGLQFDLPCYSLEIDLEIENDSELKRMILVSAGR